MLTPHARVTPDSSLARSWWIFWVGLIVFIVFQTGLVLEVQLSRAFPPEAKDAYRYIYNAVQLHEGFNYDTPALKDFRSLIEVEPGDSAYRQNQKWIDYHSLFFTHYILHSALLLLISWIFGVSLAIAYKIICVLGSLLIAGAIAYLLLTITDRTSAGLALGSMAFTMFPMQGIHYVVPTNICMAIGLILFAVMLRSGGKLKWILFSLSLILIYLHRMGIIYASLGVFAAAFLRYQEVNVKKIFIELLPTLFLIAISTIIIFVFPLRFFHMYPMATPPDTSYLKEVFFNFVELLKLYGNWFEMHGIVYLPRPIYKLMTNNWLSFIGFQALGISLMISPWLLKKDNLVKYQKIRWLLCLSGIMILLPILSAIMLIFIVREGLMYPPQEKKTSFYLSFFTFFLLLLPSVFQVMYIAEWKHPMSRADLTTRLWIPFAVVLAAVFGRGLYLVFQKIRAGSYDFLPNFVRDREPISSVLKPRYLYAGLLVFLVIGYAPRLAQAYLQRQSVESLMVFRQNVVFDPDQIKMTYQNSTPRDIIVYDDDFIRHYFLSHGGLWRRALYIPLLPLPESYKFSPDDIKYEIGWNPYLSIYRYENERAIQYPLTISGGSTFTMTLEPHFEPNKIQILPDPDNRGSGPVRLQIVRKSASGIIKKQDIRIDDNGWQTFPVVPEEGGSLSLVNLEPSQPFYLAGLKFGGEQDHNLLWAWHCVTQVSLDDHQQNIHRTDPLKDKVTIKDLSYSREVVQDKGSTVLWRLHPEKKE